MASLRKNHLLSQIEQFPWRVSNRMAVAPWSASAGSAENGNFAPIAAVIQCPQVIW